MSNPISALQGRVSEGDVTVREMGLRGMITLRGDLADPAVIAICETLTGQKFPAQGQAKARDDAGLAWMSPDEVLIMLPYPAVADAIAKIGKALAGKHVLAFDVSDARAVFQVSGLYAREVIAKLAPVDMHPTSFPVGTFRRTRLGQVAAAFWMVDSDSVQVICFRSVAEYTFKLLAASAKAGPVDHLNG